MSIVGVVVTSVVAIDWPLVRFLHNARYFVTTIKTRPLGERVMESVILEALILHSENLHAIQALVHGD